MTVTISAPSNGKRTFTFSKTVESQKLLDLGEKAALYLWNIGYGNHGTLESPRQWADVSNAEKMQILDQYLGVTLRDLAKTQVVTDAVDATRATAEQTDFDMGILPKP